MKDKENIYNLRKLKQESLNVMWRKLRLSLGTILLSLIKEKDRQSVGNTIEWNRVCGFKMPLSPLICSFTLFTHEYASTPMPVPIIHKLSFGECDMYNESIKLLWIHNWYE